MHDGLDVRDFLNNFCSVLSGIYIQKIHLSCNVLSEYDEFLKNKRLVLLICSRVKNQLNCKDFE